MGIYLFNLIPFVNTYVYIYIFYSLSSHYPRGFRVVFPYNRRYGPACFPLLPLQALLFLLVFRTQFSNGFFFALHFAYCPKICAKLLVLLLLLLLGLGTVMRLAHNFAVLSLFLLPSLLLLL